MSNEMPVRIMERIVFLLVIAVILLFYMIAGKMDYKDAILFESMYKYNVCNGIHPDYKELDINCKEG